MKGWGPKSSICPSKPRESNFFGGISRDFAGISRKRPKSLRKQCLGSIFGPYEELRGDEEMMQRALDSCSSIAHLDTAVGLKVVFQACHQSKAGTAMEYH